MGKPGRAVRAALAVFLLALLAGCSMLDYLPRSSPGRPASSVRRTRTGTPAQIRQPQQPRQEDGYELRQEPETVEPDGQRTGVFRPRSGQEAQS
ncbi:MAG TPA: hypothetical protein VN419_02830, partial [Humidesulfovibrio sp.]|uniref:hypothetical protein n=1 Tax=Humidesulfovibrio sp. TaxID=2910988 RepID=UPI002B757CD8